jgi:hypothetical protein
MEGYSTKARFRLHQLIDNLIREHGTYGRDAMDCDTNNFSISDKRLILSHITDAEEYEWACTSHVRTEALFKENIEYIEQLISEESGEVYRDIMEEMRSYK